MLELADLSFVGPDGQTAEARPKGAEAGPMHDSAMDARPLLGK